MTTPSRDPVEGEVTGLSRLIIVDSPDHEQGDKFLKENVTMGRLIPAGTGFEYDRHVRIPTDEPPPPALPQPSDDELELERDMEYFVEPDDVAIAPRTGDLE